MASSVNPCVWMSTSPPAIHMTGNTRSEATVLGEKDSFLVSRKYTIPNDKAASKVITRPDGKDSRER